VIRAALVDVILGYAQHLGRGQLLKRGLPVQARAQPGRARDHRVEQPVHQPVGHVQALVQVDRADDRLEGVREDGRLVPAPGALLALAQAHVGPELEPAGDAGQGPHVDHRGAQLGQLALGQVGILPEEGVRHDQAEHRVAQELQPLVGRQAAVLVGE
jgi:hypothetical protein